MKKDIEDISNKKTPIDTLCDTKEMSSMWNKTNSKTNNNIYTTYIRKKENHHRLKIIDMGIFCLMNDITPDMLKMGVRHIKEVAALISGDKVSTSNKIVIMSEEDYKDYQDFKEFQAFKKAHK